MRLLIVLLLFAVSSCIVKGPKYTHVEKVLTLKNGMTLNEVNTTLGLKPYDLISLDSAGNKVLMYKYRLTDRRTVPLFLKDTNGKEISAKFADLHCTFSADNVLVKLASQKSESELKEQRLDINSVMNFMSVTLPAVLIYLGFSQP